MLHTLLSVGYILALLMVVDCAINRRQLMWFFIVFFPLGSFAYLIYNWQLITFPFPLATTFANLGTGGKVVKTCSRCFRQVNRLEPYEAGRTVSYMCRMCKAEMEILRSDRLRPE